MLESAGVYPTPSASVDRPSPIGMDDAREQIAALRRYAGDQAVWSSNTVGVLKRNAIKFHGTAACLDKARASGIIN